MLPEDVFLSGCCGRRRRHGRERRGDALDKCRAVVELRLGRGRVEGISRRARDLVVARRDGIRVQDAALDGVADEARERIARAAAFDFSLGGVLAVRGRVAEAARQVLEDEDGRALSLSRTRTLLLPPGTRRHHPRHRTEDLVAAARQNLSQPWPARLMLASLSATPNTTGMPAPRCAQYSAKFTALRKWALFTLPSPTDTYSTRRSRCRRGLKASASARPTARGAWLASVEVTSRRRPTADTTMDPPTGWIRAETT